MYINQNNLEIYSSYLLNNNHLRISNFLNDGFAKRISICLEQEIDWGLACRIDGTPKAYQNTNDLDQLDSDVLHKLKSQLGVEFQFIYNTYMMVTAYIEKRDPNHYLNRILEWLNSPSVITYFKHLTGNESVKKINAQATRYLPGHFLTQHNDENLKEGRLYAYVMGFSKKWNPDWGGLLHILDENKNIIKTFIPEYNSLSIFKVPQNHFVSLVSPFAKSERLAITGWLLSK